MPKEKAEKALVSSLNIQVTFEDQDFLVINKPTGLVVNRAESVKGKTIQEWMANKLKAQSSKLKAHNSEFRKRAGVVHRLDKDTSGAMLLAKNEKSFQNLQGQFKERKIEKEYLALVHGVLEPAASRIKLPIKRSSFNRKRFNVSIKGRESLTFYQRLEIYKKEEQKFSFLRVFPKTGRTHQIRVHFKHLGFPIVSDPLYLGRKTLKKDLLWCPRLFLHSFKISLFHPKTGRKLSFKAVLPEDLKGALEKLEKISNY